MYAALDLILNLPPGQWSNGGLHQPTDFRKGHRSKCTNSGLLSCNFYVICTGTARDLVDDLITLLIATKNIM